jgi:hypothetical protein
MKEQVTLEARGVRIEVDDEGESRIWDQTPGIAFQVGLSQEPGKLFKTDPIEMAIPDSWTNQVLDGVALYDEKGRRILLFSLPLSP